MLIFMFSSRYSKRIVADSVDNLQMHIQYFLLKYRGWFMPMVKYGSRKRAMNCIPNLWQ